MDEQRRKILTIPLSLLAWPGFSTALRAQAAGAGTVHGMRIPTTHPRLWWTPERLATAKAWYGRNEKPIRNEDLTGYAFRYLMRGDKRDARTAIGRLMSLQFDVSRTSSNEARWYGEAAILIFDWCYDQFTPAERSTLVDRWNGYLDALRQKPWGGPLMPQSNYFWGYLRNELMWGIATFHENPSAEAFLDFALRVRWRDSFLVNVKGPALGGVPLEGSQYGRYLVQYSVVPFVTAQLLGRSLYAETNFFRDALCWLIYATTPMPTAGQSGGRPRLEVFPWGDDDFFKNGGSAESVEYGTFASVMADVWKDTALGQHTRQWLRDTSPARPAFVEAVERPVRDGDKAPPSLPLDYYAPGSQHLFARTSWQRDATLVHLQLGQAPMGGASHEHADHGNWQVWRGGRWLTRETTGYSQELYFTTAHNGLLLNGKGLADGDRNGQAVVKRLESREVYTYAAVDLSPAYRNDQTPSRHRRERDNPVAALVEREFLFLRPLETLIIFDRVYSNASVGPAAGVTKTFLAHFEQAPVLKGESEVIGKNGNQVLRLVTLAPATTARKVVVETPPIGQHRLEISSSGNERSYFLHVAQARGETDPDVIARVTETSSQYTVTLEHPTRGAARLVFQKESGPASLQFSRGKLPSGASPLLNRVQQIRVTDDGPQWETLPKNSVEV